MGLVHSWVYHITTWFCEGKSAQFQADMRSWAMAKRGQWSTTRTIGSSSKSFIESNLEKMVLRVQLLFNLHRNLGWALTSAVKLRCFPLICKETSAEGTPETCLLCRSKAVREDAGPICHDPWMPWLGNMMEYEKRFWPRYFVGEKISQIV